LFPCSLQHAHALIQVNEVSDGNEATKRIC
jgi:hypothetical protein